MWVAVSKDNKAELITDRPVTLRCPLCGTPSNMSAVSLPKYELLLRFQPRQVGIGYRCGSCNGAVFLRYRPTYDFGNSRIQLSDDYEQVEHPQELFESQYLPAAVQDDFTEALSCYSIGAFNAFAAMCRRCIQSAATELGAKGKDKVLSQLHDLKEMSEIDDETYDVLKQVVIEGHDGAHPHLPAINDQRAAVLLELIKDVMYQLYVRRGKLQEAMALRNGVINERKA